MNVLMCFGLIYIAAFYTATGCRLPLTEGTWYSTSRGNLVITNNISSSYIQKFTTNKTPGQTYTLECINSTDNKYVFRTTFHAFGSAFSAFTCIDITQVKSSPDVFLYYIVTPPESSTGELFSLFEKDACNNENYRTAENAHLLIRPGFEMASAVSCPNNLKGKFDVGFRKADGNLNLTEIEMDSCTENLMEFTNMHPNITLGFTSLGVYRINNGPRESMRNTKKLDPLSALVYSSNGRIILQQIFYEENVNSGTRVYFHTYNNDSSADNVNTFRFACWEVEKIGNLIRATAFPNKCVSEQNATSVPSGGQIFVYDSKDRCGESFATSSNTTKEQTSHSCNVKPSRIFVPFFLAYFVGIIFKYT